MSFMILSFVVPILFAGRLALALFSSDKIEACYIKNLAEGYVLVEQRRWQVVPQEARFPNLVETLAAAKVVCPIPQDQMKATMLIRLVDRRPGAMHIGITQKTNSVSRRSLRRKPKGTRSGSLRVQLSELVRG